MPLLCCMETGSHAQQQMSCDHQLVFTAQLSSQTTAHSTHHMQQHQRGPSNHDRRSRKSGLVRLLCYEFMLSVCGSLWRLLELLENTSSPYQHEQCSCSGRQPCGQGMVEPISHVISWPTQSRSDHADWGWLACKGADMLFHLQI